MRRVTGLLLGILLPLLGLAGIGHAQSAVQVQGNIQAVDCQTQTIILATAGGSNTIAAADSTPVLINSTSVPFCALQQYIGAPVSVWLVASGDQFVATRIDVIGEVAVVPPAPYVVPEAVPEVAPEPLPIAGIVLGTIVVAGLLYLLVHDHDGAYYRYPYYGTYYHHYYRPAYRPYLGLYPAAALIITVPAPIFGVVLGRTVVGGLDYLVARDRDGRVSRYPYYGPYRAHYYRPEYRSYQGSYFNVPVRQGDPRWDGPAYRDGHIQPALPYRTPGGPVPPRWTPPAVQNAPAPQQRWTPPAYQNAPAPQQRWTPPAYQNAPAPQQRWTPPAGQNDRYRDAPSQRTSQRCDGGRSNQGCSEGNQK